jgi:hypothetical protein
VGPLFGLPFVTGSLPHSPQLVKALTRTSRHATPHWTPYTSPRPRPRAQQEGRQQGVQEGVQEGAQEGHAVAEGRVAPLIVYLGIGR